MGNDSPKEPTYKQKRHIVERAIGKKWNELTPDMREGMDAYVRGRKWTPTKTNTVFENEK